MNELVKNIPRSHLKSMAPSFAYNFPSVRGIQAGREYYVSMCPLRLIPRIFTFDDEELPPEVRAQRILNKGRIPEISRYIVNNPGDYTFSALTASIDADIRFESLGTAGDSQQLGTLFIPMSAKFIINDGQHRRAAIEQALREKPELGDESIAIVFFVDTGLEKCQQMFADLNRYAVRPNRSLSVLYDYRDDKAKLAKLVVLKSSFFPDMVEMERTTLALRSQKLFTLSAIYQANCELLGEISTEDLEKDAEIAKDYWDEVSKQFPEWQLAKKKKMTAGEVRQDYIHCHGVTLQALAKVGNALMKKKPKGWKGELKKLKKLNWARSNSKDWSGRAINNGRLTNTSHAITLTTNRIKQHLKLALLPEEIQLEESRITQA